MTSRLDRLFTLLENCPNISLRTAAAEQLGELVQHVPTNAENIFNRLIPLIRSRSWSSRLAAADAIRSIVRHLPTWKPSSSTEMVSFSDSASASRSGFLGLSELQLDRVLSQGARLYSMDTSDLENAFTKLPQHSQNDRPITIQSTAHGKMESNENELQHTPVHRSDLNSRLGLNEDGIVSKVLAAHSNISSCNWIDPEDLIDNTDLYMDTVNQKDVDTCVRAAFCLNSGAGVKRSSSSDSHSTEPDSKLQRVDAATQDPHGNGPAAGVVQSWPLDRICTVLLGDLWAKRWETRHGAASALRELLSESRHTNECGKHAGMSEKEMEESHMRYLEDIVVRVLCTLALDQLSDFISDEVVAPVRETAAQLLGVLSLHLSTNQVFLVAKHLAFLVTLSSKVHSNQLTAHSAYTKPDPVPGPYSNNTWDNTWMIVHGGLLGIKYLLASRKDTYAFLLPTVTPGLIAQLITRTQATDQSQTNISVSAAEEDIRAAAASSLLPIVNVDWLCSLGCKQALILADQIWVLLRDTTTDLSPATGPLLQLISAITRSISALVSVYSTKEMNYDDNWCIAVGPDRVCAQFNVVVRLLHHMSSGIRQHALETMQCLFEMCSSQKMVLPSSVLQLIIDQLYHRILLEPSPAIRKMATNLCIRIVVSTTLPMLAEACADRLDFWLCQAMQPIGIPFPSHLFSALTSNAAVSWQKGLKQDGVAQDKVDSDPEHDGNTADQSTDENHLFCIGGSQSDSETYVWHTRICAVRVLSRLFGRLCQYYPENCFPVAPPVKAIEDQPSILCYFLDHLFCRLHLVERLAMQRTVSGLVLSYWALLPCVDQFANGCSPPYPASWSDLVAGLESACPIPNVHPLLINDIRMLCAALRSKLEACLTEVIYYEEILGLFKHMQEDCRQLCNAFMASELPEDPLLSTTGIRTIAQCSSMLDRASQLLNTSTVVESEANIKDSFEELRGLLGKARITVDRCLSLQLLWGSRVEFAIAAAFVNLGWLLPGRFSLLIRPFMDAIRCAPPTSILSSEHTLRSSYCLLPGGTSLHLQRMACFCLARLLYLEWRVALRSNPSDSFVNPSKAAAKVIKNLASLLTEANALTPTSPMELTNLAPGTGASCISDLSGFENRRQSSDSSVIASVPNVRALSTDVYSEVFCRETRYRGASLALAYLCNTFLEIPDQKVSSNFLPNRSEKPRRLVHFQRGLPWLWHLAWTDLIEQIRSVFEQANHDIPPSPSSWNSYITGTNINALSSSTINTKEEVIFTDLSALLACVTVLLPCADGDERESFSFECVVYVGLITSCLPSPKVRSAGVKLLTLLAMLRPVPFYNLLLPLLIPLLEIRGERCPFACHGALDALSAIVDALTLGPFSCDLRIVDVFDPFVDPEVESEPTERMEEAGSATQLPASLRLFLPFMALLVPPVLRLLPNHNATIRLSASRLFTALLNLFPFENSVPDPPNMDPSVSDERRRCRFFIESLLHPERIKQYNLPVPIRAKLRSYQQNGVNWLNFLNRFGLNGILCDDLGLGKTLQTICILAGSHHELAFDSQKQKSISLVICPSTLCGHWLFEVQQYVSTNVLSPIIYTGTPSTRQDLQTSLSQYDLVITSYDMVRNDIHFFQDMSWNYVVLDEGHIIKSSKSKVARAVKKLRAQNRLILTGTPIQNRVSELWSLFDFLMPDFLGSESDFNTRFAKPVAASRDPKASKADQRAGHLALENLHRLVLPFMLRRLKEDVLTDLPPKIIQDFSCELTSIQTILYEAFTNTDEGQQLCALLRSNYGFERQDDSAQSYVCERPRQGFQAFRYLQAICNHPCLALKANHPALDDVRRAVQTEFGPDIMLDSVYLSGKLLGLCRLLTDCGFGAPTFKMNTSSTNASTDFDAERSLMSQHRALLFFQTRDMLQLTENILRLHFPWITSTRLDGSVPVGERHNRVLRFNEDPSIDLMLLTTAVGGLGLNLTGADTVIFVEHDWNPTKDLQAMDRVHRIGQRRTVSVYRLITQDSIEQQIMNIQAFKLHLANTVITAENRDIHSMDTARLFDRFTVSTASDAGRLTADESVDDFDSYYDTEYNLDTFVAKLASYTR